MGAVGLAPCAVALPVAVQVPMKTNEIVIYMLSDHLGLSCHSVTVFSECEQGFMFRIHSAICHFIIRVRSLNRSKVK